MSAGWAIAIGAIGGAASAAIVASWSRLLGMREEWREARERVPKHIFKDEMERFGTIPLQYSGSNRAFIRLLLWIDGSVFLRPRSAPKRYFVIRDFVPPYGANVSSEALLIDSDRELVVNLHKGGTEKVQHLIRSVQARAKAGQRTLVMPTPSGSENIVRAVTVKTKPKEVHEGSVVYEVIMPKPREQEITSICNVSSVPANSVFLYPTEFGRGVGIRKLNELNEVPRFSPARNLLFWRILIPVFVLGYAVGFVDSFLELLGLPLAIVYLLFQAACGTALAILVLHEILKKMEDRWEK
ncbi:MAG: hypothetical protein F4Z02_10030 [Acidimicrobiia bacterium]|nr:hypothetical protein [Acidimicrobiia bacterium]MYG70912.1 hypothetical protein [Acidimicrobiia bacterium]